MRSLLVLLLLALGMLFVADRMLQPKIREVPLEGVPISAGPKDVTFMSGVMMDPPVQTNPFLVIFSPMERVTGTAHVVSGSIHEASDRSVWFVWSIHRYRTLWRLDRQTRGVSAVSGGSACPTIVAGIYPVMCGFYDKDRDLEIGSIQRVDISVKRKGVWINLAKE